MSTQSLVKSKTDGKQSDNSWQKLISLLDPAVTHAPRDESIWKNLHPATTYWLSHTLSKSPWFNHLTLAGIIYIQDAKPVRQYSYLQSLNQFLKWAILHRYADIASLQPEPALVAYFGEPPQRRGRSAYDAYSSLQAYMQQFLESMAEETRAELAPFLLPTLTVSKRLRKLKETIVDQAQQSRKEQAFAVVRDLPALVALGRRRYKWLANLEAQYQGVAALVRQGQVTLPVVIKCKDLDGQEELAFRVWDRLSWRAAHPGAYGPDTRKNARNERDLFLQLVGELPSTPWFLRAIQLGIYQGPNVLDAEGQKYLQQWQLPSLTSQHANLLQANRSVAAILLHVKRTAAGTPDDSRVVFCIEPLLAGAAVGLFELVCLVQTGMRLGELMQVTLDRECIESGCFPHFSDESGTWVKGPEQVYFRLYPKGREKRERYLVTNPMIEALKVLIDLHERYHGKNSLKSVKPASVHGFRHSRRFAGKYKFVLQWAGQHICSRVLEQCLDFLLLEHPCRYPDGTPVRITAHVLRHGVAGWLRSQGVPLDDIMALLKQVNIAVTDYYSKLSPQDLYAKIGPALTTLAELADVDPSTVRTVGDIQKLAQDALKQYGVLRHTPGGTCSVFIPCEVQFKCASCPAFVPDPARRTEVHNKIVACQKAIQLFAAEGDHLRADVEKAHLRDWERIEKEMTVLDTVELVSSSTSALLTDLGIDNLGAELLLNLAQTKKLSGGNESYV